jgi:hypothetical protein
LKKTIYILFIALVFLITGCKITGKYFIGDGLGFESLTLSDDSTFVFVTFHDVGGSLIINGKWTLNKKIITLNSYEKPDFKPNSILEKTIPNQNKKLIIVQCMDVSAFEAVISINNGQETDSLEVITDTIFSNDQYPFLVTGTYTTIDTVKKIHILQTNNWTDCVLKDSVFYVSDPKSNFIIIYAQPYNQYYGMKYLVNAEWKFTHNRIYNWRESKTRFAKDCYLKKKQDRNTAHKAL